MVHVVDVQLYRAILIDLNVFCEFLQALECHLFRPEDEILVRLQVSLLGRTPQVHVSNGKHLVMRLIKLLITHLCPQDFLMDGLGSDLLLLQQRAVR